MTTQRRGISLVVIGRSMGVSPFCSLRCVAVVLSFRNNSDINSASDLEFFHNCSLKGRKRTILERINNVAFARHGIEPLTL